MPAGIVFNKVVPIFSFPKMEHYTHITKIIMYFVCFSNIQFLKYICQTYYILNYVVVQSLSRDQLFATPWTAACQATLSFTISRSLLKLLSMELVMLSNHLILCHPLLLLPSIFPSIRVFPMSQHFASGDQSIGVSASASVLPINTQDWVPLGLTGLISMQSKRLSKVLSSTTVQKHQFFGTQPFLLSSFHIHTWLLEKL